MSCFTIVIIIIITTFSTAVSCTTHVVDVDEMESGSRMINIDVTSSTDLQRKKIKQAQLKILEANQKVRDLSINIR